MKFSQAIEGFCIAKTADGYSTLTIRGYQSSLGTLQEYLKNPEVQDITFEDLKRFMLFLHTDYQPERASGCTDPLATASFHRYWKAIRCFFKWAAEELQIPRPDLELKMPAFTNREIVPFTEDEIRALLKACEHTKLVVDSNRKSYQCRRPTAVRDRALILLLLDTGLRAGECVRLRVCDVNLENGEVCVMPHNIHKTRPRTVYLGNAGKKALWKYLAFREDKHPSDPLFMSINDQALTQVGIRSVIYTIAATAHVQNAHPHKFRHTFAIQYLRNGGDVFTLQRLLGHATLEMVRHYLALADTDSAEAHRRASPVDRWRL